MFKKFLSAHFDLIMFFALFLCALKFTYGMPNFMDITLFDESSYLSGGVNFLKSGITGAQVGPIYSIWYFLLSLITPQKFALYYLNQQILTILLPLILYVTLRAYKIPILNSAIITFFMLIAKVNLDVFTKVYHFATISILISLALAQKPKTFTSSIAIATIGALVGAYIRPELFLTFLIFFGIYLLSFLFKIKNLKIKDYIILGAVIITSLCAIKIFRGMPFHFQNGDRGFCAFGPSFGVNWVRWTHSTLNPMTNWNEIMQINFGTATTVKEALLNNPILFIKHVLANIPRTCNQMFKCFMLHTNILLPPLVYIYAEAYMLISAIFLYLFVLLKNKQIPIKQNFKTNLRPIFFISIYLLTSLISVLVIFPRTHYILFTGIMLILLLCILLNPKESTKNHSLKQIMIPALILFIITPSCFFFYNKTKSIPKPTEQIIRAIDDLHIKAPVNLLEAEGSLNIYLDNNYCSYPEYSKQPDEKYWDFSKRQNLNMIVVSPPLLEYSRFRADTQFHEFLADPEKYGYKVIPIGEKKLLVQKSLLNN
ncbi:MAG: hypothetical protein HQL25_00650 [Candidatus Omnitrophica bacterium]|nr:hypothetical protein [Candidatus Omnitrophota bacterium]